MTANEYARVYYRNHREQLRALARKKYEKRLAQKLHIRFTDSFLEHIRAQCNYIIDHLFASVGTSRYDHWRKQERKYNKVNDILLRHLEYHKILKNEYAAEHKKILSEMKKYCLPKGGNAG